MIIHHELCVQNAEIQDISVFIVQKTASKCPMLNDIFQTNTKPLNWHCPHPFSSANLSWQQAAAIS
jgi:hypothetical protein